MSDVFDEALKNPESASQIKLPTDDVDVGELGSDESSSSSSEGESESESESESEGSDDEEEEEGEARAAAVEEEEESGDMDAIRSKHEVAEEPVPDLPDDYEVPQGATISPIGKIKSAFDNNIVIEAVVSGEKRVLKEGCILCLEDKSVIGILCEVFGPLQKPFYRVTLPASRKEKFDQLKEKIGSNVCIVTPEAHWVDTFELKKMKGSDASNGYDEELPEEEQEFSDDEKEAIFKKMKKEQNKKKKQPKSGGVDKPVTNIQSMKVPQAMTSVSYRSRNSRQTPQQAAPAAPAAYEQPYEQPRQYQQQHISSRPTPQRMQQPQLPPQVPQQIYQPPPIPYNYGMPYVQQQTPPFQPYVSPYPHPQSLYQAPVYYPPPPQPQFPMSAPVPAPAPAPAPAQQNMQQVLQLHQLLVQQQPQQQQQQQQPGPNQHNNYGN